MCVGWFVASCHFEGEKLVSLRLLVILIVFVWVIIILSQNYNSLYFINQRK